MHGLQNTDFVLYDVTIAYFHLEKGFGKAPSVYDIQTGNLRSYKFFLHVDRFQRSELPVSDEALGKWVEDRYVKKDAFLKALEEALYDRYSCPKGHIPPEHSPLINGAVDISMSDIAKMKIL